MSDLDPGVGSALQPAGEPAGEGGDASTPLDLDAIERDLRDVESTLARLADGTYFAEQPGQGRAFVPGTDARPPSAQVDTGKDV